jgi:putative PIN family toxin of toxin-antitoxin system
MTPPGATPRAVVDTNLIVSGVILSSGNPHALLAAWRAGAFKLIFSTQQYVELVDVLSRPKLVDRYHLETDDLAALFDGLATIPRIDSIAPLPVTVRDPKDEFLLATALGASATHLVSGDDDLLDHERAGQHTPNGAARSAPFRHEHTRRFHALGPRAYDRQGPFAHCRRNLFQRSHRH